MSCYLALRVHIRRAPLPAGHCLQSWCVHLQLDEKIEPQRLSFSKKVRF